MIDPSFSIMLSLLVASLATLIAAVFGATIGYFFARSKFRGKNLLNALCMLPFFLPPTVVGFILLEILGREGLLGAWLFKTFHYSPVFTWQACVIAAFVISLPMMISTSRAAFESVDQNLEKVSYTLGRSSKDTFQKVTLPLAARGLLAGCILTFARAIGEFGATLMLAGNIPGQTQTMPLAIYEAAQSNHEELALGLVVAFSIMSVTILYLTYKLGQKW
ncbi:MAG TPA: molybdate ABC transporter permease subunit [Oculatellaceae cyanobacterium]